MLKRRITALTQVVRDDSGANKIVIRGIASTTRPRDPSAISHSPSTFGVTFIYRE
jgi:hypothetical protein